MEKKKGRGRPKKPIGEKPEQFSVRLVPMDKFGLELVARDKGLSISQAVEAAVHEFLSTTLVSGRPARDVAVDLMKVGLQIAMKPIPGGSLLSDADLIAMGANSRMFLADENARLLIMPDRLLTSEERFFVSIVKFHGILRCLPYLAEIRKRAALARNAGLMIDQIVASTGALLPDPLQDSERDYVESKLAANKKKRAGKPRAK